MFDIGLQELFIIAAVAIIVVGPKDLPKLMRSVGQFVRQIKSMAGEFRQQFDKAMDEAEMSDIKDSVNSIAKARNPMDFLNEQVQSATQSVQDQNSDEDEGIDDPIFEEFDQVENASAEDHGIVSKTQIEDEATVKPKKQAKKAKPTKKTEKAKT